MARFHIETNTRPMIGLIPIIRANDLLLYVLLLAHSPHMFPLQSETTNIEKKIKCGLLTCKSVFL